MDHMPGSDSAPLPILDSAKVLCYTLIPDSVEFTRTLTFVDGVELGRVPRLAICQYRNTSEVLLFHCDSEWSVLGCGGFSSMEKAKQRAERIYPGIGAHWIDSPYTQEEVDRGVEELFGEKRCSFCGKSPVEFENPRFIGQAGVWICEPCVRSCHELLQKDDRAN